MDMKSRIKERRLCLGLTQEELAAKLGLQKSAIAKYENGRVENIKRSVIMRMADVLMCSPCYLLALEDAPAPSAPAPSVNLSRDEDELLSRFRSLNAVGREIIMVHVRVLSESALYKKDGGSSSDSETA